MISLRTISDIRRFSSAHLVWCVRSTLVRIVLVGSIICCLISFLVALFFTAERYRFFGCHEKYYIVGLPKCKHAHQGVDKPTVSLIISGFCFLLVSIFLPLIAEWKCGHRYEIRELSHLIQYHRSIMKSCGKDKTTMIADSQLMDLFGYDRRSSHIIHSDCKSQNTARRLEVIRHLCSCLFVELYIATKKRNFAYLIPFTCLVVCGVVIPPLIIVAVGDDWIYATLTVAGTVTMYVLPVHAFLIILPGHLCVLISHYSHLTVSIPPVAWATSHILAILIAYRKENKDEMMVLKHRMKSAFDKREVDQALFLLGYDSHIFH